MEQNRKNRSIPLSIKVLQTARQLSQFTSWATVPVMLFILPRPPNHSFWARARFAAEWLAMPAILCAIVCWPAIDTQTRLIFRRYMGFRVTARTGSPRRTKFVE